MKTSSRQKEKIQVMMKVAWNLSKLTTCPRRNVGCVLLDSRFRILSTGFNGVAAGLPHCTGSKSHCTGAGLKSGEGHDKCEAIHAEQNAIIQCKNTDDIYYAIVTTQPCMTCIKMLLNTNCQVIVFDESWVDTGPLELWKSAGRQVCDLDQIEIGAFQDQKAS